MTIRYVGPGGNNGNSGLTWALRKLTLQGVENSPVVAGDIVYVGPGVYREMLTCNVSGGNVYNAGTVTVTNGSTTVQGVGTAFLANVAAGDMFRIVWFAAGNDGVTNGTATFTSAAGNFQANMVGKIIQITARNSYGIGAVAAANSITLTDPSGVGWPAAGANLVYSVPSGEGPYDVVSITDNNNFELDRPWCGPTLTGQTYLTYRPIRFIGDVTGENTDGIGGVVRIAGTDNDQTIVRFLNIAVWPRSYRLFRGFRMDCSSFAGVAITTGVHCTVEDCVFTDDTSGPGIYSTGVTEGHCVRRCMFYYIERGVHFVDSSPANQGHLVENCIFRDFPSDIGVVCENVGGVTVKNCTFTGGWRGVYGFNTNGNTVIVNNSIFGALNFGVVAGMLGQVVEDYNTFFGNDTNRTNTGVGANSQTFPAIPISPILRDGYKFPWWSGELSEWSQVRASAGAFEPCGDLRGSVRPITSAKKSWGPLQFTDMERDTGTVYAGAVSMEISDAGRVQFKVPIAAESTTVEVYIYREANYAGTNPQLVIKQPGQADRMTTDTGAAGAWNLLTDTFTPAALPPYIFIELVSNNTAVAGNYATYWDNLRVG